MDPILFIFLKAAAGAIIILVTAYLYLYLRQSRKITKDNCTQTNNKNYKTIGTCTYQREYNSIGSQIREQKSATTDQGIDAAIIPYGATCEQTNFVFAIPTRERTARAVSDALIHRIFTIMGPPQYLSVDKDKALTGAVIFFYSIGINELHNANNKPVESREL